MKKGLLFLCIFLCIWCMAGCGKEEEAENLFPVYYISKSETKIEMHQYAMQATEPKEQIEELLRALAIVPAKNEYKAPLAMGFQILDYNLQNGKLLINMDENYKDLTSFQEVLVRAAIVRTMTQHPKVSFVAIRVNNEQLFDNQGQLVGWMSADQFIENEGSEINNYEEVRIKLYFANEAGDGLIATNRTKEYNTNISLEKLIVEELIKGPNAEGVYPTINPATKVANVTVKDGVCYVNLDENFLNNIYNVTPDVTIFSITNSLVELSNVNKVQISVNGDSSGVYREKYNLTTYFEKNTDIMTTIDS
ncbi:MAG: GerMN domain-containing protein [Lachnospiraceae bacterium]|nr:GerMN domain-containing protein [Lachnospiraceae bacterium]